MSLESTASQTAFQVDRDHALQLLQQMIRIRRFEGKCAELSSATKIRGFLHLYDGEEAVAVGVMQALTPEDAIVATYREHGHALARGISAGAIMAEMYGGNRKAALVGAGDRCISSMPRRASMVATPSSEAACRWPWA
jgi:TPP-dependent pyruvate/acetoin dehydrogenase alpha subunit